MMKKSIWKMKRNSIVRQATKSVVKEFRPLIKSAIIRPSNIQHIRDSSAKFLSQEESLLPIGDAISILSSSSYTIPDARNLLLGVCRGSVKAHNCSQVLMIAKRNYDSLDLVSDSRLITALLLCSIDIGDEKFALRIAELGVTDPTCQNHVIDIVRAIIQNNRAHLEDEEISKSVGKLLLQFREKLNFSTHECKIIFRHYKQEDTEVAIHYGLLVSDFDDAKFNRVLCRILNENSLEKESYQISKKVSKSTGDSWHTDQVALHDGIKSTSSKITRLINNLPSSDFQEREIEVIAKYIQESESDNWKIFNLFNLLFKIHYEYRDAGDLAFECGKKLVSSGFNQADLMIKLASLMMYDGQFTEASNLLKGAEEHPSVTKKMAAIEARIKELDDSLKIVPNFSPQRKKNSESIENRVLYMLHNSLPYESGGYATRSHGLLCGVRQNGWDIQAVTRLAYPLDLTKHHGKSIPPKSEVDGVTYHRLQPNDIGYGDIPLRKYIQSYAEELHDYVRDLKPSILHGASNHMNGHAANLVAQELGIPSVYEVRGLWEITRASRQPNWYGSEQYKFVENMEAKAAKDATAVICITQALADEMVRRGVNREKITLVHNGVHVDRFTPRKRDNGLAKELAIDDQVVIGYVGSIVGYEGLNMLVEAAENLQQRNILNFTMLIIGDGAALESLEDQVSDSPASRHFIFTGRVPHEDVERYYSLIDIAPFPRLSQPVTEMVSPLKPFEAMAMEKLVIASNVAALEEIVNHEETGLLFEKDNVDSLTNVLELGITDPKMRLKLGKQARKWVKDERDWPILAKRVTAIYESLSEN
jgi:glycosyltransferase involved in cell wall biosynthesis